MNYGILQIKGLILRKRIKKYMKKIYQNIRKKHIKKTVRYIL